jgi:hypothetical protein
MYNSGKFRGIKNRCHIDVYITSKDMKKTPKIIALSTKIN